MDEPAVDTEQPREPLRGIKVLDLSKILAGPYVTMSLSDLGAEVLKVESPGTGDATRTWGPPFNGPDATYYLATNRNKRSLQLDLKNAEGQEVVHRLLETADVVVENFRPGSSLQEVFDYRSLSERYPQLVVLHISAFGELGPMSGEPGYDMVAQASGGLMSLTGTRGGPPMKAGYAMGDLGAALFGTIGVCSALVDRERTGRGSYVTTSLYESQLAMHVSWATSYFSTGVDPEPLGTEHPNLAPYQAYPTEGGYLVIAAGNDKLWRSVCTVIGRPELADDPLFLSNADRVVNRGLMNKEIESALAGHGVGHWCERLGAAGVPVSPIRSIAEVYASEQTAALGIVQSVDHPVIGELKQVGFPVSFNGDRPQVRSAPPLLGEHSRSVLRELGYDEEGVDRILATAAVTEPAK